MNLTMFLVNRPCLGLLAMGLMLFAIAVPIQADIVSSGGTVLYVETYEMSNSSGWTLGDSNQPIGVILDPNAGPWVKNLWGPGGANVNADDTGYVYSSIYWFTEVLHISGTLSWTDWHEAVTTPGWDLGVFSVKLADGSNPSGLSVVNLPSDWPTHGGGADIYFDALTPCHTLVIQKQLVWIGDPNVQGNLFSGSIQMVQYPTPEPATLSLLALGGLAMLRRKSKQ